ncbi:MAG: hypothetical protein V3T83_22045 [Acidobacteriota bacterium]
MKLTWIRKDTIQLLLILAVYFASSFVQMPVDEADLEGVAHLRLGRLAIGPPRVLSGDSPHYLAGVTSLVEDGDFDLANNYRRAEQGGFDLGTRFRGRSVDRHTDLDQRGREIPNHSPFFALLLSAFAFPFAGTAWVEPVCIWATMLAGFLCIAWLRLKVPATWWAGALAFATPFWCYSRDLWTEPWSALLWLALLFCRHPAVLFAAASAGILIKYPFAVVPALMGVLAWRRGERSKATALLLGSVAGLATAVGTAQWLFRDVDHFSLLHSGIHGGFDFPLDGMLGLLFSPENGLLFFFPFLIWAGRPMWRDKELLWPAVGFFLLHAAYSDWMGGTGFSARYLVPLLPVAIYALSRIEPRGWPFRAALAYSLMWGMVGGLAPALVYDRTPWGTVAHVIDRLAGQDTQR